jgi:D-serine deaminase-like pyridoxal phosphate-dependent protein
VPDYERAGTFEFETASGVYTELQCGSYIFMDADYGRNLDRDGAPAKAFEPSLFVWATVMSRPTEDRAIVDAGLKALAFDSGPPLVCDAAYGITARRVATTDRLRIGDKLRLTDHRPGHRVSNAHSLTVPRHAQRRRSDPCEGIRSKDLPLAATPSEPRRRDTDTPRRG